MADNPLYTSTGDNSHAGDTTSNPAVELIRQKVARLYEDEPDAKQEIAEAEAAGQHRSKHQQFMHQLSSSGKSLAEIQTEWHHYYTNLPDNEKHAVWQEFYAQHNPNNPTAQPAPATAEPSTSEPLQPPAAQPVEPARTLPTSIYPTPTAFEVPGSFRPSTSLPGAVDLNPQPEPPQQPVFSYEDSQDSRQPDTIRQQLRDTVSVRAKVKLKPRHHLQSLLFGLGCGGLALLFVLFSFFNELVIAPFIQPSRSVSATPIIIGADGVAPTDKAEVIIPKINVQIPLVFDVPTIKEADVQKGLERGVVHYPTTAMPGQQGNAAFFGHSSNNIFNPGAYKFAFVLLHELVPGDTFYLTRDGVAYAYQVIDKKIVDPTEIGILDKVPGKTATATLITCDPPGTTLRRLAVIGEQVSPNPSANLPGAPATPAANTDAKDDVTLPGDAPSLWRRLTSWITE